MKFSFLITVLSLTIVSANIKAQDNNSGIIYGDNHAYSLTAPKGWILDNSSGVGQGLHAVFYPLHSTWATSSTVMYTNVALLDTLIDENMDDIIKYDIGQFKKTSPGITIKEEQSIKIDNVKRTARVFYFLGDSNGNYEAVAYIGESKVVVMIVFTARSKKEFNKDIGKFDELVKSYRWMTDNVKIE